MRTRRSARLQRAICDAEAERTAKRRRHGSPAIDENLPRAPLADVSNATSVLTCTTHRESPAIPTRKAYKRARGTGRTKQDTEQRLHGKPSSQQRPATVTTRQTTKAARNTLRSSRTQERDTKRAANEQVLAKNSATMGQGSAASTALVPKKQDTDPTAALSARRKSKYLSPPSSMRDAKNASADKMASERNDGYRPKTSRQSPSPPPLYPEDDVQPIKHLPKGPRHERKPKRPPRPPSPPPLYPDDEIQPLPTKLEKKQPSYGAKATLKKDAGLRAPDSKFQAPSLKSPIPSAFLQQNTVTQLSSSSPSEREHNIVKSSSSNDIPTAKPVALPQPSIGGLAPSSETPKNDHLRQKKSPISVFTTRAQSPGFRSEGESWSVYRSDVGAKAPAPIHTYSKKRQNAQDLALPSRRALGVRSRPSSGDSPDSKDNPYGSQGEQPSDEEESEDSESEEESEQKDRALISFIGEQKKLWDEIDSIDLEEDLI